MCSCEKRQTSFGMKQTSFGKRKTSFRRWLQRVAVRIKFKPLEQTMQGPSQSMIKKGVKPPVGLQLPRIQRWHYKSTCIYLHVFIWLTKGGKDGITILLCLLKL